MKTVKLQVVFKESCLKEDGKYHTIFNKNEIVVDGQGISLEVNTENDNPFVAMDSVFDLLGKDDVEDIMIVTFDKPTTDVPQG